MDGASPLVFYDRDHGDCHRTSSTPFPHLTGASDDRRRRTAGAVLPCVMMLARARESG
jgi:hypothetical protein